MRDLILRNPANLEKSVEDVFSYIVTNSLRNQGVTLIKESKQDRRNCVKIPDNLYEKISKYIKGEEGRMFQIWDGSFWEAKVIEAGTKRESGISITPTNVSLISKPNVI